MGRDDVWRRRTMKTILEPKPSDAMRTPTPCGLTISRSGSHQGRLIAVLVLLLSGQLFGQVTEETRAWVEARESGGRNVRGKDSEVGPMQIRPIAWSEVNRHRKTKGQPTHPFSAAWNIPMNRQYGHEFLEICRQRFIRLQKREPNRQELWRVYRRW